MKKADTDIDIDFQNRENALNGLEYCRAIIKNDDNIKPHNSGIYFQEIPCDLTTGLATIDTKEAEDRGYFKLDFLNVSLYDGIKDEKHLDKLLKDDPLWEMLDDDFFVSKLWHIHSHFELIKKMKPRTVEQLAMCLGIIRPAKRHLLNKQWNEIEKDIWKKPEKGDIGYKHKDSFFKKSHSISYALGIIVQMNLLAESVSDV